MNQKESIAIEKLHENGLYLKRYKNQTEAMCLAAIKQNGRLLQYVKEQTLRFV